jgi:hypothetical protein
MISDGAMTLLGFAWHARRQPGVGSPGPGGHPFDGVESRYRPLCWPIGPEESGVRNGGPGPAFLVIMPTLSFGPPEVGRDWEVEPAELDGFRTEDGRVRLVGRERHRTRRGTVTECEFEEESGPRGARDLAEPLDGLPDRGTAVIGVPGAVVMTGSAAA